MFWLDVQRMQILPRVPEPNTGVPYQQLIAFIDREEVKDEIIRYSSVWHVPEIHYFTAAKEFIGTLSVVATDTSTGWQPQLCLEHKPTD